MDLEAGARLGSASPAGGGAAGGSSGKSGIARAFLSPSPVHHQRLSRIAILPNSGFLAGAGHGAREVSACCRDHRVPWWHPAVDAPEARKGPGHAGLRALARRSPAVTKILKCVSGWRKWCSSSHLGIPEESAARRASACLAWSKQIGPFQEHLPFNWQSCQCVLLTR